MRVVVGYESFKPSYAHGIKQAINNSSEYNSLFKQLRAWIPFAMSLATLLMILGYVAILGVAHSKDEGTPARIFQFIMMAQIPIVAYFVFKWLPKRPAQVLVVQALQATGWIISIITAIWFESF